MILNIDQIVSREWGKQMIAVVEPLNGGFTNQTYKVTVSEQKFVVRINGNENKYLQLSRTSEVEVIRKMHEKRIAPKVYSKSMEDRYLITEFVRGRHLHKDDLKSQHTLKLLITSLNHIHSLEGINRECSPFTLVSGYLQGARELNVAFPADLTGILNKMDEIEKKRAQDRIYTKKFCHNDLHLFNMLFNDEKLTVIDWELSGYGDVFFDIASIALTNQFSIEEEKKFLSLYFGFYDEEQFIILQEMKYMNMIREITWSFLHHGLNHDKNLENDYYQFALHVIERLKQGYNYL
jgi:thiamine kinase-like enzyme